MEHIYQCRAPDEEAEDLICSECYPEGEDGHYSCSCWINPPKELEVQVYLTCQDAFMRGNTENGVYTLKPDHLPSFQVRSKTNFKIYMQQLMVIILKTLKLLSDIS